jgi:hypothetical protein
MTQWNFLLIASWNLVSARNQHPLDFQMIRRLHHSVLLYLEKDVRMELFNQMTQVLVSFF